MGWGAGASTGILLLDFIVKPFMKFALKFPVAGIMFLLLFYGFIAYHVVKSAYLSEC